MINAPQIKNEKIWTGETKIKLQDSIKRIYENEEIEINLEVNNNKIDVTIKQRQNLLNVNFNLENLIEKDKYFKKFDNIDQAYDEIMTMFKEDKFKLENIENNLMLNLILEYNNNKNFLSFPLEKKIMKTEDLINSLYNITYQCLKENNKLKTDVQFLSKKIESLDTKVNLIENKIGIITKYINNKNELKVKKLLRKKVNSFEDIIKVSNILDSVEQMSNLKIWLSSYFKNELKFKLIYDAERDGDYASVFHSICDFRKNTLTIISTSDDKIIGGFLSKSFGGNLEEISDENAFLFNLNYNEKYPSLKAGGNYFDREKKGPIFGNYSIFINNHFLTRKDNYYCSFTKRYDFGNRNNNQNHYFRVINLELYQILD